MAEALLLTYFNKGTKMKNYTSQKTLKLALVLTVVGLLTACGTSKSSSPTDQSSNRLELNSQKALALCNKGSDSNFSFQTSIVSDQSGQLSKEWIKFKFKFLNAEITKPGNVIKFFKWRVANGQAILSETALDVSAYDLTTGQTTTSSTNSLATNQINNSQGFYINLADPDALFQVLKVVAYNSDGKVIGNLNSLIPAFYANPADYQYNIDGSPRAQILQDLQLLKGTTTTDASAVQSFNQYCF